MYRPNSIKTLISMKREKEEKLSKSLSVFEMEKKEEEKQDYYLPESYSDNEQKIHQFSNLENVKNLLKAVDETLQNLRVWKKAEKTDFEKQIRENEQKILLLSPHQQEYEEHLDKYMKEMEEIQKNCADQIDKYTKKFNKDEIGSFNFAKESEESFLKIKETNQKLENLITKHQMSFGQSLENDVQRQFFQHATESLNLEKLNKSLQKWQENMDVFYKPRENNDEEVDLKNMEKIKIERNKVQEKAIEDSKMSEKIKNEMDEIDKELEELENMLG